MTSQVGAAAATGHHTSWLPASPIITTECLAACMRAAHHGEAVPEVARGDDAFHGGLVRTTLGVEGVARASRRRMRRP